MKYILKYFVIALLVFFCSCTKKNSKKEGTIELVTWVTYQGTEKKKFNEIIERFSQVYEKKTGKKVKIIPKQVPFDDLITNIKMASMAHRTPDMARVDVQKILELSYHKVLVSIDKLSNFTAKSIDEKAKEYMDVPFYTNVVESKNRDGKFERHLYGLPEQTSCLALFWNRKLFRERAIELKKAGLDPKRAPQTWEELIQYGKILTYRREDEQIYGFAMRNSLWWTLPFFGAFGTKFIKTTKKGKKFSNLGDPFSLAALQLKVDLYQKYKIEAGAWKSGAIGNNVGFVNEKYAMIFMGPWRVKEFREKGLDFGVALIPGISKKRAKKIGLKNPPRSATNIGGNNFVIFESCKYKEEAYAFLKYLTSWEVQLEWCLDLKQIPVNRKASEILYGQKMHPNNQKLEVDPIIQIFMEQIKYAVLPPRLPRYGYIESDVVNPEMELALKGNKTVRDALKTASRKIDKNVLSLVNE